MGEDNPMFGKRTIGFTGRKHTEETIEQMRLIKLEENNPLWKGNSVQRVQLHAWVRSRLAEPKLCEMCNERPPHDLANKTGIYNRDLENWYYLCRKCHMVSDGRIKNLRNQ